MNRKFVCVLLVCASLTFCICMVEAQQLQIPSWIKNTAQWWYDGKINDSEFAKGIQYLIENKIMIIPLDNSTSYHENKIPVWVKNTAGWWSKGKISDSEFVHAIQYLIKMGALHLNLEQGSLHDSSQPTCYNYTTAAEKETCLQQIEYNKKISNAISSSISYDIGPTTFYYVNSEFQSVSDGKGILTVHFVIKNNSSQEITLYCLRPDSCNYGLTDGEREIPYATNTLVYGSLTLPPKTSKLVDWTFYDSFDPSKEYVFLIKEPWGSGSIPLKIR